MNLLSTPKCIYNIILIKLCVKQSFLLCYQIRNNYTLGIGKARPKMLLEEIKKSRCACESYIFYFLLLYIN